MYRTILFTLAVFVALAAASTSYGTLGSRLNPIRVENGTAFVRDDLGVYITEPNTAERFVPTSAHYEHDKRFPDNGWQDSLWTYNNYNYYSAFWTVPNVPTYNSGQILFFFNSLENSAYNDILQPVLQFNNGVAGWTLASWYGVGNTYYESTPVAVNPGDTIQGLIGISGGNTWVIQGFVNGVFKTQLTVAYSTLGAQANAQWALEVYNVQNCASYPPNNILTASNIVLGVNGYVSTPTWYLSTSTSNVCGVSGYGSSNSATLTWRH